MRKSYITIEMKSFQFRKIEKKLIANFFIYFILQAYISFVTTLIFRLITLEKDFSFDHEFSSKDNDSK